MSTMRARCPSCDTLTAVALDDGYECHVCGAVFSLGLVRVAGAFGTGGQAMAEAATALVVPYPEAAVIRETSLVDQTAAVVRALPERPLLLGGCCCAHLGAIRGLAARHERLAVLWFDAHGDLNTPESSPSGNEWGMPLRFAIEGGDVDPSRVALVGARDLDPPEVAYMGSVGIDDDVMRVLRDADACYVAFDADVLDPAEVACFMPCPGGPTLDEALAMLRGIARNEVPVVGLGVTALLPEADPAIVTQLVSAVGL